MSRRPHVRPGALLALLLMPFAVRAQEPRPDSGWPWDPDLTNVPARDRQPRPAGRIDNQRHLLAPEALGGWRTYLGDLHAHSRGHDLPGESTPNIQRDEVALSAWYFGYDFIAVTNHASSWKVTDQLAPLYRTYVGRTSPEPLDLVALKGVESYAGPGNQAHFNAFHRLVILDTDSLAVWHNALLAFSAEDPLLSTHVQLNHPNPGEPWFRLPPESEPEARRRVRQVVELAEYKGRASFFELLRRGFRVAPVSNTDSHANFHHEPEPGVPPEKTRGEASGPRAGIVLPAGEPFSYEAFLRALRERRAFHTTVAAASGFFLANGHPMGAEFTLAPDERRLDLTVWASTRGGRAGLDGWRRLEVWSPFQPDAPLAVFEPGASAPVDLKHTLSLTPYESVYVVRLERERPDAEVVLAPVWITNPLARPALSLEREGLSARGPPCLRIRGGGEALLLQRADATDAPGVWHTVAALPAGAPCHPVEPSPPAGTRWRVVDALQDEVFSNTVRPPEQ
jgi:hypothetical protein